MELGVVSDEAEDTSVLSSTGVAQTEVVVTEENSVVTFCGEDWVESTWQPSSSSACKNRSGLLIKDRGVTLGAVFRGAFWGTWMFRLKWEINASLSLDD